jgi:malate synthase
VKDQFGSAGRYDEGAALFDEITASEEFVDFLTLPAYERID